MLRRAARAQRGGIRRDQLFPFATIVAAIPGTVVANGNSCSDGAQAQRALRLAERPGEARRCGIRIS